jgi:outer membrane protein OmpA-like peptidoglycan-associated protein
MVICRKARRLASLAAVALSLAACVLGGSNGPPYMVYFPLRSAQLDGTGRDVVALAAEMANEAPAARVTVIGYTDSAGSPPADVLLSQHRAQAVADALAADGVASTRIVRVGAGQTNEAPGVASRRVEITVGGWRRIGAS